MERKLMRKLSKVADSSQYCLLRSESRAAQRTESFRKRSSGVPQGHLPVYVGDEMERFVVSAELLNHPIFVELLNKSAQEYGYEQKGVLRIPCHAFLFNKIILNRKKEGLSSAMVAGILTVPEDGWRLAERRKFAAVVVFFHRQQK